jgi:acetoacetate decarboxylase
VLTEPVVNYGFIRMPDSTGFGDYALGTHQMQK